MSAGDDNSEAETADICCCASCGVAEVDDIKLVPCDGCDLVRYCSDACQQELDRNMKQNAKNERVNYEMNYYSSSLKAVIMVTARSVVYLYRSIQKNLEYKVAAVNTSAMDVHTPINYISFKSIWNVHAHSVVILYHMHRTK